MVRNCCSCVLSSSESLCAGYVASAWFTLVNESWKSPSLYASSAGHHAQRQR
jgi:hypothetical protein